MHLSICVVYREYERRNAYERERGYDYDERKEEEAKDHERSSKGQDQGTPPVQKDPFDDTPEQIDHAEKKDSERRNK